VALFKDVLGDDKVVARPPVMGGEDFSRYGRAGIPAFLYFLGTQAPEKVAAAAKSGKSLPSLHSDSFAPVPEPTIKTGVLTMSLAVLDLLEKPK
jgi:hippurate hydrolase